jgi:signal transduction histidine kinase
MMSGASVRKQIGDATVWIQVGENLAHKDVIIDDVVADFFKRVGWITLPILLALLAIDILIFRRALRPLRQASQIAETISPNRTDIRLPVDEIPTEIRPLVLAVNQALDRLEQGFQIQREFTADAAHELRTPLAILRARVETLANQQVTTALHQDIEGMSRIVTQLLDIAELETFAIDPAERVDLRTVCTEVAASIAPLAVAQGKSICLSADDRSVWVRGSSEMLFRAIRNVAENAVSHTPKGETAEIVLTKDGTVSVLDSGPGISEDERDLLFRRFWRRDRRRAGGAGLGLSIVQRIAQAHGATLTVENRPTGGANFSVCFPAVEGDDDVSIDHKSAPLVPHPDRHVREDVQEVIRGLGEQRSS